MIGCCLFLHVFLHLYEHHCGKTNSKLLSDVVGIAILCSDDYCKDVCLILSIAAICLVWVKQFFY